MTTWANDSPNPQAVIEQFKVLTITHLKNTAPLEHEYLIIETLDIKLKEVTFLILKFSHSQTECINRRTGDHKRRTCYSYGRI